MIFNDDRNVESTESFLVFLSNVVTDRVGRNVVTIADGQGAAIIRNDDTASIVIDNLVMSESAGAAIFTVTLTGEVAHGFTVDYRTADDSRMTATVAGGDYVAAFGSLRLAGRDGEQQKIRVIINDDTIVETNESLLVYLSNVITTSVGRGVVQIADSQGSTTILDNDAAASKSNGRWGNFKISGGRPKTSKFAPSEQTLGSGLQRWTPGSRPQRLTLKSGPQRLPWHRRKKKGDSQVLRIALSINRLSCECGFDWESFCDQQILRFVIKSLERR